MTAQHQGGCQCGAVRFSVAGDPKFISNCHCLSCRKATGAAYSTWVGFKKQNTQWTRGTPAFFASSAEVARGYCRDCGTPLTFASEQWAGELHFLVGAFDHPEAFAPRTEAFIEDALSWAPRLQKDKT